MKRADLTEKILDIKREKGWTWKHICDQIGSCPESFVDKVFPRWINAEYCLIKPQAPAILGACLTPSKSR